MEEKKFRSLSLRAIAVEEVETFIKENPDFIRQNPEYNSVAGFVYQATRRELQRLKKNGIEKLQNAETE